MTAPTQPPVRCVLPPTYLGRKVEIVVEKVGSRWQLGGLDPVANVVYPVNLGRFATRKACVEALARHDLRPGDTLWAMPEIRS